MKLNEITSVALSIAVAVTGVAGPSHSPAGAEVLQAARPITIDILPNRKENEVKLSDKDKSIQVVVLGETNFDVRQIEPGTVEMAGARPVAQNGRRLDSNLDQQSDVEYRFQIGKLALTDTTKTICLTGKLLNGDLFRGCGEVVVKP